MIEYINYLSENFPTIENKLIIYAPDTCMAVNPIQLTADIDDCKKLQVPYLDYHSIKHQIPFYIGLHMNDHHWQTSYLWTNVLPLILIHFKMDFDLNSFELCENVVNGHNLSYHELKNDNSIYDVEVYTKSKKFQGNHIEAVRAFDEPYDETCHYSPYHRLFKGSHMCSKISNSNAKSDRTLLVSCDSMAIPLIPILCYFWKTIYSFDNRTQTSFKHFAQEGMPQDFLSIRQTFYQLNYSTQNLK